MKILIVGSGFSGAVVANELSKNKNNSILVVDERSHIGGNCHTETDVDTGIIVHKYGPHIFHTSNKFIWDFINEFDEFVPFINRVKSVYKANVYSLPINLHTINQFFSKIFSPHEAKKYIESISDNSILEPKNFEEQALKFIGKDLYKAFFYGYTKKQWGVEPSSLPASILKRLPVRFNYDDNYYNDVFQGIPKNGYTYIIEKMLNHNNVTVELNTQFDSGFSVDLFDIIIYTGPIDKYFNYKYGKLSYRTVYFEKERHLGDYQGNAVINYADENIPYTRIHEHKHFTPWLNFDETLIFKEYSKETLDGDVPYYPKRLDDDMLKYEKYLEDVSELQDTYFLGRLATYRYLDMHNIIEEALNLSKQLKLKYKI